MQREVDINGDRCSWDEDEFVTTTHEQAQSGAITKYVDDSIDFVNLVENITYREFLQQLKALEEAQQKKSKEEERNRNIATLMEMIEQ
jgi:hypothetical protein